MCQRMRDDPVDLLLRQEPEKIDAIACDLPVVGKSNHRNSGLACNRRDCLNRTGEKWTEDDLKSLHGVGPKALRILKDALARQGRRLRIE